MEVQTQLNIARQIQYGLVPERENLKGNGFSIFAMTHPAKAVGGDFYDCFQRSDGRVCIIMGDVSGKGVTAAIFMAMIIAVIHEKLNMGLSPSETLNQTNDEIYVKNPNNLFATVFATVLNPVTGELCYANAGHTHPILLKEEPLYLHPDAGTVLGLFENPGIQDATLHLAPGQGILLYTDGVTEAVNPERQFFGEERLLDTLRRADIASNAEDILYAVSRAVHAFCNGCEPFDDMAAQALLWKKS